MSAFRPGVLAGCRSLALVRLGASLMGIALLVSFWASPDRVASLPWFAIAMIGVILVLLTTGSWLSAIGRRVRPSQLLSFFLAAGLVTFFVTLFASRWPTYKLSWLGAAYAAIPSIRSLPFSWARDGLQPNQTGGMLALCTAFAAVVVMASAVPRKFRYPAIFLVVTGSAGVFMTGSRAALAGLVVAVLVAAMVRTRHWLWAWGSGLALLALGLFISGQLSRIFQFLVRDETLETKLVARLDIWSSALNGIQDHLLTGIGLGVFNQVIPVRYPYQTVGLSYPVSQAHNLVLDITLAIGLPGIIGFVLLLIGSLTMIRDILRQDHSRSDEGVIAGDRLTSVVSLGILASLVVFLVFGVTDSISLSIPTSFIIWLWVCALVILTQVTRARESFSSCLDPLEA